MATASNPIMVTAGYYTGGQINGQIPNVNVQYVHHIHSLITDADTTTNNSADQYSVSGGYSDGYASTESGGCFTSGRYTKHSHSSACYHRHIDSCKSERATSHIHDGCPKHEHTPSCYTTEQHTHTIAAGCWDYGKANEWEWRSGEQRAGDSSAKGSWYGKCSKCSKWFEVDSDGDKAIHKHKLICEKGTGTVTTYTCKYSINGQPLTGDALYECENLPLNAGYVTDYTCGYDDGEEICNGSPLNSTYRYFKSCRYTSGQVVKAVITY